MLPCAEGGHTHSLNSYLPPLISFIMAEGSAKVPRPARAEAGKTGECQINCKRDHLARSENARMVCNGFD